MLTPETMRFIGSTKKDIDSDKNSENVPKLDSVEVVLVHCNLINQKFYLVLFQINNLGN